MPIGQNWVKILLAIGILFPTLSSYRFPFEAPNELYADQYHAIPIPLPPVDTLRGGFFDPDVEIRGTTITGYEPTPWFSIPYPEYPGDKSIQLPGFGAHPKKP